MNVPEHLTEIFTFENLLKAFRSSASNHRHKADVQEFLNHLYLNIRRIEKTFKRGEYPEITYHSFIVTEPKLRVVWATSFEIRVIQHCFCDVFLTPSLNRYMYLETVHAEKIKARITLPNV